MGLKSTEEVNEQMKSINEHLAAIGKALDHPSTAKAAEKAKASVAAHSGDEETRRAVASWARQVAPPTIDPRQEAKRLGIEAFSQGQQIRYGTAAAPTTDHFGVIDGFDTRTNIIKVRRYELPDDDYGTAKASETHDNINLTLIKEVLTGWPTATARTDSFTRSIAGWLGRR